MSGSAKRHALVLGAGGFIGAHLVRRLKREGFWVRGVDLEFPRFSETEADEFVQGDLRDQELCSSVIDRHFDEVYQFAADMGGAGYVFTGEHDADIIHNSATINLNLVDACRSRNIRKIFYSSSACVYPATISRTPPIRTAPNLRRIRRRRTPSTAGRSSFPSACSWPTIAITAWRTGWRVSTIFSARKEHGGAAKRKRRRPFAERSRQRKTTEK